MNKKWLLTAALSAVLTLPLVFGLAACDDNGDTKGDGNETENVEITAAIWKKEFEGIKEYTENSRFADDNGTYTIIQMDENGTLFVKSKDKPQFDTVMTSIYTIEEELYYIYDRIDDGEWMRSTRTQLQYSRYYGEMTFYFNCLLTLKDRFSDFTGSLDEAAKTHAFTAESLSVTVASLDPAEEEETRTLSKVRVEFQKGKLSYCSFESDHYGKGAVLYEYTFEDVTINLPESFNEE